MDLSLVLNFTLTFTFRVCIWLIFTSLCWNIVSITLGPWDLFSQVFNPELVIEIGFPGGSINLLAVELGTKSLNPAYYNPLAGPSVHPLMLSGLESDAYTTLSSGYNRSELAKFTTEIEGTGAWVDVDTNPDYTAEKQWRSSNTGGVRKATMTTLHSSPQGT